MDTPFVEFDNVALRYGSGPEILREVSFAVAPRSFHFLTGASGSGKTSLLRLVLGALTPTGGAVRLFGQDSASLVGTALTSVRRRMGVVFQDFRLLDHLSAFDNVALPLRVRGREEASYRAEVVELLQWVGLGDRMDAAPPLLSGGEKQRAAIARALIAHPELIIADEPTGNVDPPLARRLLHLFLELNRLGTAVILATHDTGLLEQLDAPRLILHDGRLFLDE